MFAMYNRAPFLILFITGFKMQNNVWTSIGNV